MSERKDRTGEPIEVSDESIAFARIIQGNWVDAPSDEQVDATIADTEKRERTEDVVVSDAAIWFARQMQKTTKKSS